MSNLTVETVGATESTSAVNHNNNKVSGFAVLRTAWSIGALGLMLFGELQIFRGDPYFDVNPSLIMMGVGLLLIVLNTGNILLRQPELVLQTAGNKAPPVRIRLIWLGLGIALSVYLAWLTVYSPTTYAPEAALLWLLAMIALMLAVWPKRGDMAGQPDEKPFARWELLLLAGLLLGALAMRVVALGSVPYMMDQDESDLAHEGAALVRNYQGQTSPFAAGDYSLDYAFVLLTGYATLIFGKTLFAARIFSALFGAFTVPIVYLFGREVFNRKVGLVAALFMLGWAFHIQFSRIGFNLTGDVFFSTLSCYFLARGLRRQTTINYVLCGICVAVAQVFYVGARLVPIVILVYLIWMFLCERRTVLHQWRQIALLILAGFLISLPPNYLLFALQQPVSSLFAKESVLSGLLQDAIAHGNGMQFILGQLHDAFGSLIIGQDIDWYGRGSNLMGWIGAPLLLIGTAATLLILWRRPRTALPFVWVSGVMLGGAALQHGAWAYERMFPGSAAFSLLVGLGVWYAVEGVGRILKRPQVTRYLIPVLGALILIGNSAFYIFDYVPARGYFVNYQNWMANRVANVMVQADQAGRYIVLVAGYATGIFNTPMMQYYLMGTQYTYVEGALAAALSNQDPGQSIAFDKPLTFLVAPSRMDDLATLEDTFPGGRVQAVYLLENNTLAFYLYEVDRTQF